MLKSLYETPEARRWRERVEANKEKVKCATPGCITELRADNRDHEDGLCDLCRRKKADPAQLITARPGRTVRYCPRGHDTQGFGRNPAGRCRQCDREDKAAKAAAKAKAAQHFFVPNLGAAKKAKAARDGTRCFWKHAQEATGIKANTARKWAGLEAKAKEEDIQKLAKFFEVTPEYLKDLKGEEE